MKNISFLLYFFCMAVAFSVSTADIESLRLSVQDSSLELTASQKELISKFWRSTLDEMMITRSSIECTEIRRQLAEQKGDNYLSNYAVDYVAEAKAEIEAAFGNAARMRDPQRLMIERNLMILAGELKSPDMAPLALQRLDAEDDVVQYWAFKAVTHPVVIEQLKSEVVGDKKMTQTILTDLKERVSKDLQAPMLKMVIGFCEAIDDPLSADLLISIANHRIKAYEDWSVSGAEQDLSLLVTLGKNAVLRPDPDRRVFVQNFAELYALMIQRYLKGKAALPIKEIEELRGVIIEVDKSILTRIIGVETKITQYAARNRDNDLAEEYKSFFGDRMVKGKLAKKFDFDYGKDNSGRPITMPRDLRPMPGSMRRPD